MAIIGLCFLLSGICGLVYEVVWIRMLVLQLGSTTFAVAAVTSAFMAGLALGSFTFGKLVDRFGGALLFYALLEIAIGVYAIMAPAILDCATGLYRVVYARYGMSLYAFSLLRFAVAFVVLIVPTCFMGGTLPVLGRYFAQRVEQVGRRVGFLYGINTLGAALGAFGAGFLLLPRFGLSHTIWLASAANIAVGGLVMLVWLVDLGLRPKDGRAAAAPATEAAERGARPAGLSLFLIAFGVSGFCGMVYEVAWSRVLTLIIGSSVYGVATILVTFLLGIGLGSMLCSALASRSGRQGFNFGMLLVFVALTSFGTMLCFQELPYWFLACFKRIGGRYDLLLMLNFGLSMAVMLVPTVLQGMTFPVVMGACASDAKRVGSSVGEAYCVNTIGAIFGSFAAGFVLVPFLGIQQTVLVAIGADALFGLVLVLRSQMCGIAVKTAVLATMVLFAAVAPRALPRWNRLLMSSGVYHYARALNMIPTERLHAIYGGEGDELLYYSEGISATVCVAERRTGERYMRINGKVDASTGDLPTQVLMGHLPFLLGPPNGPPTGPSLAHTLVVGYGSGVTVGSALCHQVRSLVCVEIEPKVVEAGACFDDVNGRPLVDDRLTVEFNDARNYFLMADRKFDVIISQPSNPWITGVSNLFTREFFELGASRLEDGGIFCQWIQVYCLAPQSLRVLLATFHEVFPHLLVFVPAEGDLILVGARKPIDLRLKDVETRLDAPRVRQDLARIGIKSAADLASRLLLDTKQVEAYIGPNPPINTDDNALIEFAAPKTIHQATIGANLAALRKVAKQALAPRLLNALGNDKPAERADFLLDVAQALRKQGWMPEAIDVAIQANREAETARSRRALGSLYAQAGFNGAALAQWSKALELDPGDTHTMAQIADAYVKQRDFAKADSLLHKLLSLDPNHAQGRYLKGLILLEQDKPQDALREFRIARRQVGAAMDLPALFYKTGLCLKRLGQLDKAAKHLAHYLELVPADIDARFDLGVVYYNLGRRTDAVEQWQLGVDVTRRKSRALLLQANEALRNGQHQKAEARLRAAIDLDRLNLDAYFLLGRMLDSQGRVSAGIELFEGLVRRQPLNKLAHLILGRLYQKAGNNPKAVSQYREYLRLEVSAKRRAKVKLLLKAIQAAQ